MVSMTIGNLRTEYNLPRSAINETQYDTVRKEELGSEVYVKESIDALLAQPNAIALCPLNLFFDGKNQTILVGVSEGVGSKGTEYLPMLEDENLVVLPLKIMCNIHDKLI